MLLLNEGGTTAAHPGGGIPGFVQLAGAALTKDFSAFTLFGEGWFGKKDFSPFIFYNAAMNRIDVMLKQTNYPSRGDSVSFTFCFEPSFPIRQFTPIDFGLKASDPSLQESIERARKRKAERLEEWNNKKRKAVPSTSTPLRKS